MSEKQWSETNSDLPLEICDYIGLIRDEEIRAAISKDFLLVKDTTEESRIRQASYELRLSDNVEFLILSDGVGGKGGARYERPANGIGARLRIEPGQTVKVYTKESFNLPTNVVAHVFPVGNVYKLGLSPETTYADPGFDGDFYIIICNYSGRIVELQVGQPIARVEFVKLARSTHKPHSGSKHISESLIWPRRVDRRLADELRKLGIDYLLKELEEKDPPHIEHAFIASEVRKQLIESLHGVSRRLGTLERKSAWLNVLGYIFCAIAMFWIIGMIWRILPINIQQKVAEETAKWIFGILVLGLPFLSKKIRQTIQLAVFGNRSELPTSQDNDSSTNTP